MPIPAISGRTGSLERRATRVIGASRSPAQPLVDPPGAGRLHLADQSVQALDLGVGAAEVGRLVVDGGAQLPFLAVEALEIGRQAVDLGREPLRLPAQRLA